MAEKSDDIKQLFSHLGLNPNDYHEIRSAPTANATVSEAPRRWSLLQAAPAPVSIAQQMARPSALAAAPVAVASVAAAPAVTSLLAAAAVSEAPPTFEPQPVPQALPADLSAALLAQPVAASALDDLQSLFQSVKEPQTVSSFDSDKGGEESRLTGRRTDQLFQKSPVAPSLAARAASFDQLHAPVAAPTPQSLLPEVADEPETRYAVPSSRLGPIPVAAPLAAPAPVPVAAIGNGRLNLRLDAPGSAPASKKTNETMQDVFRRLSQGRST